MDNSEPLAIDRQLWIGLFRWESIDQLAARLAYPDSTPRSEVREMVIFIASLDSFWAAKPDVYDQADKYGWELWRMCGGSNKSKLQMLRQIVCGFKVDKTE